MSITNIERMSQEACTSFFNFCEENHPELIELHTKLTSSLTRYISYQELPLLLEPISMTYKEAFAIMGYELDWTTEDEKELCAFFESMDEDDQRLKRIEKALVALQPSYWYNPELSEVYVSPSERAYFTAIRLHSTASGGKVENIAKDKSWGENFARVTRDQARRIRLGTFTFPPIIKEWDLPPRWVFCVPDDKNYCVISKHAMADRLTDLYIRLQGKNRTIARAVIDKICNEEGRSSE